MPAIAPELEISSADGNPGFQINCAKTVEGECLAAGRPSDGPADLLAGHLVLTRSRSASPSLHTSRPAKSADTPLNGSFSANLILRLCHLRNIKVQITSEMDQP